MYRLLDPSVHSVAFSVDDFGLIPIYDVVERDSMICDCWLVLAIRQTVPTKASVEVETSTIIN